MVKNIETEKQELLLGAILDFYRKHKNYRISQSEFASLVCILSQQFIHDV